MAQKTQKSIFHWGPEGKRPHKVEAVHFQDWDGSPNFEVQCRYCKADCDSPAVLDGWPCVSDEEKREIDATILRAARLRVVARDKKAQQLRARVEAGACLACGEFHHSDRCDGRCERCGDDPCSCDRA